ncbi:MAG: Ribosomal RNA small subunit methyltransferase B [Gemmatimonadaceae bacterium]|nr:Ribosomal RNA small subunit methyltransferase B [Gemmatimonadaceae bacterium]
MLTSDGSPPCYLSLMTQDRTQGTGSTVAKSQVTDGRRAAADILGDLRDGTLLDTAFDERVAALDARDRRWTRELVFGTLRRRAWIDAILERSVHGGLGRLDPQLTDILRLGVYQLLCMGSVPPYAAIAQSVELAKTRRGVGAGRLANAVLRRTDRERVALAPELLPVADDIDALALRESHPRWLVARWLARWGSLETARLLNANNQEAPIVVRPYGVVREQLEAALERSGVTCDDVPLLPDSIRISGHASLQELGAYRQGMFFVQDPAATLVTRYAAIPSGSVVVDLCAAPGGKALELARDARMVVACDRSELRLMRVRENVARLGAGGVSLVVTDAREPAIGQARVVLLDAPCTGTGTFRRHPDARWRLKVSDLAVMAAIQRGMLDSAAAIVAPNGLLVYSTCSLEPEENDAQIDAFLDRHRDWLLEPPPPGAVPDGVLDHGRLRVLPQRHGVDGAFAARLRRVSLP